MSVTCCLLCCALILMLKFSDMCTNEKLNRYHLIAAGNYVILRDNIRIILLSALLSPSEPRRRHVTAPPRPRQPPGQRGLRPAAARSRYLLRESVPGQHEVDPHTGCFYRTAVLQPAYRVFLSHGSPHYILYTGCF